MEETLSRVMWHLYEPIHASIYFHPQASAVFRDLGLKGGWMGYFATRAAPLGTPSTRVVQALFYDFAPNLISRAIPDAWIYSKPADILEARFQLAEDLIDKANTNVQNELISNLSRQLLELAKSLEISGRALYAAHLDID